MRNATPEAAVAVAGVKVLVGQEILVQVVVKTEATKSSV